MSDTGGAAAKAEPTRKRSVKDKVKTFFKGSKENVNQLPSTASTPSAPSAPAAAAPGRPSAPPAAPGQPASAADNGVIDTADGGPKVPQTTMEKMSAKAHDAYDDIK